MISTTDTLQQTINIVDDVELLAILGLTSPPRSPYLCNTDSLAVLDWDDMPELSATEEDEDEDTLSVSNNSNKKRKLEDDEENDDIFAKFDFVEVSLIPPQQKKQKTLLIQEPFTYKEQEQEEESNKPTFLQSNDEQDITLALDHLISSVVNDVENSVTSSA